MFCTLCRNAEKWVFTLEDDFKWNSGVTVPNDIAFVDKAGVRRLEIMQSGTIRVLKSYSWDGCTPKVCVLDIVIGIPDGVVDSSTKRPKTYYASLIHDALYQFLNVELPYTRRQADRFFLNLMTDTQFRWRYVYYLAVWIFGGFFGWLGRALRRNRGRQVPFYHPVTLLEGRLTPGGGGRQPPVRVWVGSGTGGPAEQGFCPSFYALRRATPPLAPSARKTVDSTTSAPRPLARARDGGTAWPRPKGAGGCSSATSTGPSSSLVRRLDTGCIKPANAHTTFGFLTSLEETA